MSEHGTQVASPPEAARILAEIGTLLQLHSADRFRASAFASAARALEGTDRDLSALAREGRLDTLPGVGAGIAGVLGELLLSGRSRLHEELVERTPVGLFDLMRLPGLGTKRIRILHERLGIDSLDSLETAAREGRISLLPGFGVRTQEKLLAGVEFVRAVKGRRLLPRALEVAERLEEALRSSPGVQTVGLAGEARRRAPVVSRLDLVAACVDPNAVFSAFSGFHGISDAHHDDDGYLKGRLLDGLPVRIRCTDPARFAGALLWETGSEAHLNALRERAAAAGMELDEEGLRARGVVSPAADEAALYTALGLQYLPPELREGAGEVDRAREGRTPSLVELEDLRGTFHCHTTASDGKDTLAGMVAGAAAQGWDYLGIADHSRTAAYAGGLSPEALLAQVEEIRRYDGDSAGPRLFAGVESDILVDGSLDYPQDILAQLDYVVGSVHSAFRIGRDRMTARLIRAIRHPLLTMLGHATGRLLLRREGYEVDLDAVIDAAAEHGVVMEINSHPNRLDIDWETARSAASRGVLIAINPDAHSVAALDHVAYGVNVARRAGLEPRQILNCWPLNEVERYLGERKQARTA